MHDDSVLSRIDIRLSAIETKMAELDANVAAIQKEVGNDLPHQLADMESKLEGKLDNLTTIVSEVHAYAIPDAK